MGNKVENDRVSGQIGFAIDEAAVRLLDKVTNLLNRHNKVAKRPCECSHCKGVRMFQRRLLTFMTEVCCELPLALSSRRLAAIQKQEAAKREAVAV